MKRFAIGLAIQVAAVVWGLSAAPEAHAWLKICNGRQDTVSYQHQYWSSSCPECGDAGKWRDEGWWVMAPGQCKTVYSGSAKRYFYYTAFSSTGAKWVGPWAWYVSNDAHSRCPCIADDIAQVCSHGTCIPHAVWRGHRELNPGSTDYTLTLTN
jgi:uncharacterized membrane protein